MHVVILNFHFRTFLIITEDHLLTQNNSFGTTFHNANKNPILHVNDNFGALIQNIEKYQYFSA